MTAKLLNVSPDEYHRRPGFSASIAKTLIARSPLHAKTEHGKPPTAEMERGDVVHRLVLGKGKDFEILDFDNYKTDKAKAARDKVRADGRVPILRDKFIEAGKIAVEVRRQLAERGVELTGQSEVAIEWSEDSPSGPVLCRGMLDHLWLDRGLILDLKITANASPSFIERNAENLGYAIQQTAYSRALTALRPDLAGRVDFLFAFCEAEAPYALNLCRGDGMFREIGERRWLRAVHAWGACTATNTWPSYGDDINPLSPPGWAMAREDFAA